MIYIIGVFLIFLSLLFDEGSTFLLILRGLSPLETNIIYSRFGWLLTAIISIIIYLFILYFWGWTLKKYDVIYRLKPWYYKWYDIYVFLWCFFIIFISFSKIEVGYSNINLVVDTFDEAKYSALKDNVRYIEELKSEDYLKYQQLVDKSYFQIFSVDYLKIIFIMVCSYLFFRVGYKVCPYDQA